MVLAPVHVAAVNNGDQLRRYVPVPAVSRWLHQGNEAHCLKESNKVHSERYSHVDY